MNGYLKQSTASQSRLIGPFVDDTDFKTAETGLTIANTDIILRANGTTLANKNSGGGTHQANGMYSVTWDATDTANVGELFFSVKVAGALQVFGSYVVLEEAVYDALFGASAAGYQVPIWSSAGATVNLSATTVATVTTTGTATAVTTVNGLANNVITAASIAADAITDAKVASDVTIASVTGAVGSVTAAVTVGTNNDKTGYALTSAYDFAKGTTAMTEAYAANGAAPTPVEAIFAIHQYLMQFGITTTSYNVKKLDNTTAAFTVTLDDATTPSAAART